MRIIRGYRHAPSNCQGAVLALGNFDGIHHGHHHVIEHTKTIAKEADKPCGVLTFEPHPVSVLAPDKKAWRILSFRQKMQALANTSIDMAIVIPFTHAFATIPANEFISSILHDALKVQHVVIGHDFTFGHKRAGNSTLLETTAQEYGFNVTQLTAQGDAKTHYSSSRIRNLLHEGKIEEIKTILGRPYTIEGRVHSGKKLARTLGFPTANIPLPLQCYPAKGVYVVEAFIEGESKPRQAVANLGIRPTFTDDQMMLEVHLFDYEADIYGKRINVLFHHHLRPEHPFSGPDALKNQIEQDCMQAREWFSTHQLPSKPKQQHAS